MDKFIKNVNDSQRLFSPNRNYYDQSTKDERGLLSARTVLSVRRKKESSFKERGVVGYHKIGDGSNSQ